MTTTQTVEHQFESHPINHECQPSSRWTSNCCASATWVFDWNY
jgi:hypothetical protein